jgi:hypothetical protein
MERLPTSSATTEKPRPASPARADSVAVFKANRFVYWANNDAKASRHFHFKFKSSIQDLITFTLRSRDRNFYSQLPTLSLLITTYSF